MIMMIDAGHLSINSPTKSTSFYELKTEMFSERPSKDFRAVCQD